MLTGTRERTFNPISSLVTSLALFRSPNVSNRIGMLNVGHNPPRGGVSGRGQGLPAGKSNYWPQSAYHAHHPYGFPLGGVREGGEKRLHKLILLVGRRDADAASLQSAKLPPLCWIQLAIVNRSFPPLFSHFPRCR